MLDEVMVLNMYHKKEIKRLGDGASSLNDFFIHVLEQVKPTAEQATYRF